MQSSHRPAKSLPQWVSSTAVVGSEKVAGKLWHPPSGSTHPCAQNGASTAGAASGAAGVSGLRVPPQPSQPPAANKTSAT